MINYDQITKENTEEHDSNWSWTIDHPYRTLISRGLRSGKNKRIT